MLYFDIGAYVGEKTQEFVSLGARVIAVEPNPDSYASLVKRFQDNHKVICINKAVSDTMGEARLSTPSCNLKTVCTLCPDKWFTGRFEGLKEQGFHQVRTTTLDKLIKKYGKPDFIKIDAEGWETHVLHGLSQKVNLSFEYRGDFLADVQTCLDHLQTLGQFQCLWSKGDRWHSDYMSAEELMRQLKQTIKIEPGLWGDVVVRYD